MNKRIKELAEQAGVFEGVFTKHGGVPCDLKGYGMLADEMAKFAELIVRECAKRVDYWESRQGEHADDLLKHFGVEE
jgi:hypothetical protein